MRFRARGSLVDLATNLPALLGEDYFAGLLGVFLDRPKKLSRHSKHVLSAEPLIDFLKIFRAFFGMNLSI